MDCRPLRVRVIVGVPALYQALLSSGLVRVQTRGCAAGINSSAVQGLVLLPPGARTSSHQFWDLAQRMATLEFVLSGVCHVKHTEKAVRGKSNIKALVELSGSSPGFLPVTTRPVRLAKAEASPTSLPVCQGDNWPNYPSCSKKP